MTQNKTISSINYNYMVQFDLSEHTSPYSPHSLYYNGAYESTMRIMKRTDSGYLK